MKGSPRENSPTCSCSSCKSTRAPLKRSDGEGIDKLNLGKNIPLKERILLTKLTRARADYDDLRTKLLFSSSGTEKADLRARKHVKHPDGTDSSSTLLDIVDVVDRGATLNSLSECCSCCICSSTDVEHKRHKRKHGHRQHTETISEGREEVKRKSEMESKAKSELPTKLTEPKKSAEQKYKPKENAVLKKVLDTTTSKIKSISCTCTLKFSGLIKESKEAVKKLRKEKKPKKEIEDIEGSWIDDYESGQIIRRPKELSREYYESIEDTKFKFKKHLKAGADKSLEKLKESKTKIKTKAKNTLEKIKMQESKAKIKDIAGQSIEKLKESKTKLKAKIKKSIEKINPHTRARTKPTKPKHEEEIKPSTPRSVTLNSKTESEIAFPVDNDSLEKFRKKHKNIKDWACGPECIPKKCRPRKCLEILIRKKGHKTKQTRIKSPKIHQITSSSASSQAGGISTTQVGPKTKVIPQKKNKKEGHKKPQINLSMKGKSIEGLERKILSKTNSSTSSISVMSVKKGTTWRKGKRKKETSLERKRSIKSVTDVVSSRSIKKSVKSMSAVKSKVSCICVTPERKTSTKSMTVISLPSAKLSQPASLAKKPEINHRTRKITAERKKRSVSRSTTPTSSTVSIIQKPRAHRPPKHKVKKIKAIHAARSTSSKSTAVVPVKLRKKPAPHKPKKVNNFVTSQSRTAIPRPRPVETRPEMVASRSITDVPHPPRPRPPQKVRPHRPKSITSQGITAVSQHHKNIRPEPINSETSSERQAVRIRSTFSFDIEFYKNKPDVQYERIEPKKEIRDTGTGKKKKNKHRYSQQTVTTSRQNTTINSLRRCFCTLKLGKPNKIKRPIAKHVSKGSETSEQSINTIPSQREMHVSRTVATEKREKDRYRQRKLLPYACEPGVCVPNSCYPSECIKLINKREGPHLKRRTSRSVTSNHKTRSSSSFTSRKIHHKTKRVQSTVFTYKTEVPEKYQQTVTTITKPPRVARTSPSSTSRQAVRMGSSFSFSIEFYKNRPTVASEVPVKQVHRREITRKEVREHASSKPPKKKHPKKVKAKASESSSHMNAKHKQKSISMKTQQTGNIGSAIVKCFCNLKLRKAKPKMKAAQTTAKEELKVATVGTETKRKKYKLKPYECEPYVCIPGECDPYECLERITKRMHSGTSPERIRTRSVSSTFYSFASSAAIGTSRPRVKRQDTSTKRKKIRNVSESVGQTLVSGPTGTAPKQIHLIKKPVAAPARQAVRIGSTFSFDIEFYKNRPSLDERVIVYPSSERQIHESLRQIKERKTEHKDKQTVSNRRNMKSPAKIVSHSNQKSQAATTEKRDRNNSVKPLLKRCFCTLQLQKELRKKQKPTAKIYTVSRVTVGETRLTAQKQLMSYQSKHNTLGHDYELYRSREITIGKKRYLHPDSSACTKPSSSEYNMAPKQKQSSQLCHKGQSSNERSFQLKPWVSYSSSETPEETEIDSFTSFVTYSKSNTEPQSGKQNQTSKFMESSEQKTSFSFSRSLLSSISPVIRRWFCTMHTDTSNKNNKADKLSPESRNGTFSTIKCDLGHCELIMKGSKATKSKSSCASMNGSLIKVKNRLKRSNLTMDLQMEPLSSFPQVIKSVPIHSEKEAVYAVSNFTFNMEYQKTKQFLTRLPCPSRMVRPVLDSKSIKYVTQIPYKRTTVNNFHTDHSNSTSTKKFEANISRKITPKLKSCPCTMKLQSKRRKKYSSMQNITTIFKNNKHEIKPQTRPNTKPLRSIQIYRLDRNECDPGVCTPGSCQPNECLKLINLRNQNRELSKIYRKEKQVYKQPYKPIATAHSRSVVTKEKTRKRPKLLPHECEPGVCVPGSCNPIKCLERINQRNFKQMGTDARRPTSESTKTSNTTRTRTRQVQRYHERPKAAHSTATTKAPKEQKYYRERVMKVPTDKVIESSHSSSDRQAVRIGSNFSFNIEFFNDRGGGGSHEIITKESKEREVKTRPSRMKPPKTRHVKSYGPKNIRSMQSQSVAKHVRNQMTEVKPYLKRCFCTLKLQNRNKDESGKSTKTKPVKKTVKNVSSVVSKKPQKVKKQYQKEQPHETKIHKHKNKALASSFTTANLKVIMAPKAGVSTTTTKKTRSKQKARLLTRYECEPGVCTPGQCNPYECLKRIKNREIKTTKSGTHHHRERSTSSHTTQTAKQRRGQTTGKHQKYHRHSQMTTKKPQVTPEKHLVEESRFKSTSNSLRQAVRISSSFSFNVELYKETPSSYKSVKPAKPTPITNIKQDPKRTKSRASNVHEKQMKHHGAQHKTKTDHKGAGIRPLLQRCFCTLALKKGEHKQNATKHTPNNVESKTVATKTKKERKQKVKEHKVKSNTATVGVATKEKLYLLKPYECEPFVCVSGQCDPYECDKRIRKRIMKDCGTGDKPCKNQCAVTYTLKDGTFRCIDTQCDMNRKLGAKTTATIATRPPKLHPVPQYCKPTKQNVIHIPKNSQRQSVKIGSSFSFDIEFFKDRIAGSIAKEKVNIPKEKYLPRPVKAKEAATRKLPKNTTGTGKSNHYRDQKHGAVVATNHKGTGMHPLKRCFCTLKLKKSLAPPLNVMRVEVQQKAATQTKPMRDKKEKPRKLAPYECDPGYCIPGECDPWKCLERIRRKLYKEQGTGTPVCDQGTKCIAAKCIPSCRNHNTQCNLKHEKKYTQKTECVSTQRPKQMPRQGIVEVPRFPKFGQGVKIGSNISCSIEFYKETIQPPCGIKYAPRPEKIHRVQEPKQYKQPKIVQECAALMHAKTGYSSKRRSKDFDMQAECTEKAHKGIDAGKIIKRCFCTLKLQDTAACKKIYTVGRVAVLEDRRNPSLVCKVTKNEVKNSIGSKFNTHENCLFPTRLDCNCYDCLKFKENQLMCNITHNANKIDSMKTIFPYHPHKFNNNVSSTLINNNKMRHKFIDNIYCSRGNYDRNKKHDILALKDSRKKEKKEKKTKKYKQPVQKESEKTLSSKFKKFIRRCMGLFKKSPTEKNVPNKLRKLPELIKPTERMKKNKRSKQEKKSDSNVLKTSKSDRHPTNAKIMCVPKTSKSVKVTKVSERDNRNCIFQEKGKNYSSFQSGDTAQTQIKKNIQNEMNISQNLKKLVNNRLENTIQNLIAPLSTEINKNNNVMCYYSQMYYNDHKNNFMKNRPPFMDHKVVQMATMKRCVKNCDPKLCISTMKCPRSGKPVKVYKDLFHTQDLKNCKPPKHVSKNPNYSNMVNSQGICCSGDKPKEIPSVEPNIGQCKNKMTGTKPDPKPKAKHPNDKTDTCKTKKPCACSKSGRRKVCSLFRKTEIKDPDKKHVEFTLSKNEHGKCVVECEVASPKDVSKIKKALNKSTKKKLVCDRKPLLEMRLGSDDLRILNRGDVYDEIKKMSTMKLGRETGAHYKNIESYGDLTTEQLIQIHGKSCSCCICMNRRKPDRSLRLLKGQKPCICGSKPYAKLSLKTTTKAMARIKAERDKPKEIPLLEMRLGSDDLRILNRGDVYDEIKKMSTMKLGRETGAHYKNIESYGDLTTEQLIQIHGKSCSCCICMNRRKPNKSLRLLKGQKPCICGSKPCAKLSLKTVTKAMARMKAERDKPKEIPLVEPNVGKCKNKITGTKPDPKPKAKHPNDKTDTCKTKKPCACSKSGRRKVLSLFRKKEIKDPDKKHVEFTLSKNEHGKCVVECEVASPKDVSKIKKALNKSTKKKLVCDRKPLLEMRLGSDDLRILNRGDVYDEIKKMGTMKLGRETGAHYNNFESYGDLTTEQLIQMHGKSCSCCICMNQRKPDRSLRLLKGQKPCICGSKPCAKLSLKTATKAMARMKAERERKVCPCGMVICHSETLKQDVKNKIISKKKASKLKKKGMNRKELREQKKKKEAFLERQKRYKIEDDERRKRQRKEDKYLEQQVRKYENTNDVLLVAESTLDFTKLAVGTVARTIRCMCRSIINFKNTVQSMKNAKDDPARILTNIKGAYEDSGTRSTFRRIRKRLAATRIVQLFQKRMANVPIINFAVHAFDMDPKKRLAKKKSRARRREPIQFECSLFMASLRRRPYLAIYYMCPWFYPHCVSMIGILRQFADVMLFLLAVVVWSPCILAMEICRTLMCCTLCTG